MLSHSMTTKQVLSLFKGNQTLCDINNEYPSLKQSSLPRHLGTCTKPLKSSQSISINKLSNLTTTEHHHEKDSKKQESKNVKDETESIELFPYKQDDKINNKLYKKHRYQRTIMNDKLSDDDDEQRDNTN